jgi:hypothetical protein
VSRKAPDGWFEMLSSLEGKKAARPGCRDGSGSELLYLLHKEWVEEVAAGGYRVTALGVAELTRAWGPR